MSPTKTTDIVLFLTATWYNNIYVYIRETPIFKDFYTYKKRHFI